jgi:hypothetical protein
MFGFVRYRLVFVGLAYLSLGLIIAQTERVLCYFLLSQYSIHFLIIAYVSVKYGTPVHYGR